MSETVRPSTQYYRNRAIVRKIAKEGTGLLPERMTDDALWTRLRSQSSLLAASAWEQNGLTPALARAAWEIQEIEAELDWRRHQLRFGLTG